MDHNGAVSVTDVVEVDGFDEALICAFKSDTKHTKTHENTQKHTNPERVG